MPEKDKKQLLLRLSPSLWEEISRWAEDDFRSVNGQIEYILTEAVRQRRKSKKNNDEKNAPFGAFFADSLKQQGRKNPSAT